MRTINVSGTMGLVVLLLNVFLAGTAFGASITVTSPNGGEVWRRGSTPTIRWTSRDVSGNVRIILRKGEARHSELSGPSGVPNTGSFPWVIGNDVALDNDYRIVVKSMDDTVHDRSDSVFTVGPHARRAAPPSPPPPGPPSITVVSPNGGETLRKGSVATIRWQRRSVTGNMRIVLSKATGYTKELTGPSGFSHVRGTFPFSVTNDIPSGEDYKIVMSSMDNSVRDESDEFFSIKSPPATEGHADVSSEQPIDLAVTDIFMDGMRFKARIVASEGFYPPDYVEVTGYDLTQRHMIHAGNNDIVIGEVAILMGDFRRLTVTVDPNNRFRETNESNNSMQKDVWYRDIGGEVTTNLRGGLFASGGTVRVPCNPNVSAAGIDLVLRNLGGLPVTWWESNVEVRQSGRRPRGGGYLGDENFNTEILTARKYYAGPTGGLRESSSHPLQPGDYGIVALRLSDITQVDSVVTFSFSGPLASWGMANPMAFTLDFGHVSFTDPSGCQYGD